MILGENLTPSGSDWNHKNTLGSFPPGIYALGNVGHYTDSPIHTDGFGILIITTGFSGSRKLYIIADCQMGGGIKSGLLST